MSTALARLRGRLDARLLGVALAVVFVGVGVLLLVFGVDVVFGRGWALICGGVLSLVLGLLVVPT